MARIYTLVCVMLPTIEGEVKVQMDNQTFDTHEKAESRKKALDRMNLPFKSYVISFDDPRVEEAAEAEGY